MLAPVEIDMTPYRRGREPGGFKDFQLKDSILKAKRGIQVIEELRPPLSNWTKMVPYGTLKVEEFVAWSNLPKPLLAK